MRILRSVNTGGGFALQNCLVKNTDKSVLLTEIYVNQSWQFLSTETLPTMAHKRTGDEENGSNGSSDTKKAKSVSFPF